MAALTQDRKTPRKELAVTEVWPVAAATEIFNGGLVVKNAAGYAVPANAGDDNKPGGARAEEYVDNTAGANGDKKIKVARGVFKYDNDTAGNALAQANAGEHVFARDDQTVGNNLSGQPIGMLAEIDDDGGIWCDMRQDPPTYVNTEKEVVNAPGALSPVVHYTDLQVDGTDAFTLADGVRVGDRKIVRCTAATTTPNGTLTPTNFADGTSLTFDAVGEEAELEWDGTNWFLVALNGATLNA